MRRILRKIAEGETNNLGDITTLLDPAVVDIFNAVTKARGEQGVLIHNPPYQHQEQSVRLSLNGKSLMVMTGTGSGKTECFLLPILGKLAIEAKHRPKAFAERRKPNWQNR